MSFLYEYAVEKQRRQDEAAQARQHSQFFSQVDASKASAEMPMPRYQRMVIRFGEGMVVWGTRLQSRYVRLTHEPIALPNRDAMTISGFKS